MPVRQATEREKEQLGKIVSPAITRGRVRTATPEEVSGLKESNDGIMRRIIQRAMGTDVDDPMELERLGTVMGGAIGGSMVGSRTPVAPGPAGFFVNPITGAIAGGLGGAVGGAVAPEATLEFMEKVGMLPPGAREERGLSNDELRRVVEGEALLELATAGTLTGIRATGRFVARRAAGVGREGTEVAERAAGQGVELAPFQVGQRGLGRGIVNVFGRFPIVGGKARKLGKAQDEVFRNIANDTSFRIGPLVSNSTLGVKVYEDARGLLKTTQKHFNERYGDLFLRANRAGVKVNPDNTVSAAQSTLSELLERAPRAESGQAKSLGRAGELARDFIQKEILGEDNIGQMTLGQMDEFIAKVDQEIASAPKEVRRQVAKILSPIKGAAKSDIEKNLIAEGNPQAVAEIGQQLKAIDADFAETMRSIFETVAAKRFGRVRREGLKGAVRQSEEATTVPVDKLAKAMMDMDSPQVIDELSRLVSEDTMSQLAARTVADTFESAITRTSNGETILRAESLAKSFGITGKGGQRAEAFQRLLRDSPLTMDDVRTLVEAARRIEQAPIPNASTFIARRGAIGGGQAVIRGVLPFLAFSGGGAAAGGGVGSAIGGLLFFGGARALTSALSDPKHARSLKAIMSDEASTLVRRAAWLRMARAGLNGMQEAGDIAAENMDDMTRFMNDLAKDLFPREGRGGRTRPSERKSVTETR